MRKLYLMLVLFALCLSTVSIVSAATTTCDPGTYTVSVNSARVRASSKTTAPQLALLHRNDGVPVTGGEAGGIVSHSSLWCMVSMSDGRIGYVHSSLLVLATETTAVAPIQVVTAPVPVVIAPVQAGVITSTAIPSYASTPIPVVPHLACPKNCDGAIAMGLTPQEAAKCPGLDRDHDGVACYGN